MSPNKNDMLQKSEERQDVVETDEKHDWQSNNDGKRRQQNHAERNRKGKHVFNPNGLQLQQKSE
jgi:hypothetical protein